MLVLSRKTGERILIGDQIRITVVRISGGGVRIGIEAPGELPVVREELQLDADDFEAEVQRLSESKNSNSASSPTGQSKPDHAGSGRAVSEGKQKSKDESGASSKRPGSRKNRYKKPLGDNKSTGPVDDGPTRSPFPRKPR